MFSVELKVDLAKNRRLRSDLDRSQPSLRPLVSAQKKVSDLLVRRVSSQISSSKANTTTRALLVKIKRSSHARRTQQKKTSEGYELTLRPFKSFDINRSIKLPIEKFGVIPDENAKKTVLEQRAVVRDIKSRLKVTRDIAKEATSELVKGVYACLE